MSESDVNIIIGKITRKLLFILVPLFIVGIGGKGLADHFTIKNKVDRLEYMEAQGELILLVEKKTRAIESLAKTNAQEISHQKELIKRIEKYQESIDKYLRDTYRNRGSRNTLPSY